MLAFLLNNEFLVKCGFNYNNLFSEPSTIVCPLCMLTHLVFKIACWVSTVTTLFYRGGQQKHIKAKHVQGHTAHKLDQGFKPTGITVETRLDPFMRHSLATATPQKLYGQHQVFCLFVSHLYLFSANSSLAFLWGTTHLSPSVHVTQTGLALEGITLAAST